MARKLSAVVIACALASHAPTGLTQDAPPASSPAPVNQPPKFDPKNRADRPFKPGINFEELRGTFEQLPPEEKQRIKQNLLRWKEMSPEEREAMRARAQEQRQQMLTAVEEAVKKSGLQLDADRRQVFALRYAQERRKIEEKLRREMEEKRRPMLEEMVARLKAEFSAAGSPSPTPPVK